MNIAERTWNLPGTKSLKKLKQIPRTGKEIGTYVQNKERTTRKAGSTHIKEKFLFLTFLVIILVLVAVFARRLCPYDPDAQNLLMAQKAPSLEHPFGTDRFGRDMLSRVIAGSTVSIFSTLILVLIISTVGTAIGMICGWCGGKVDEILMRITDLFLAFPSLIFAMAVAGVLGGGIQNAVIALGVISWPKFARLARSLTMTKKEEPYIMASRLAGSSAPQILFRHILPNIAGPILVTAVLDIGTMLMELAGLSFLGFGAKPPAAEWGSMLNDGRALLQIAPWMVLAPGGAVFVTVMVFNLWGDTLRDYINPKEKNGGKNR